MSKVFVERRIRQNAKRHANRSTGTTISCFIRGVWQWLGLQEENLDLRSLALKLLLWVRRWLSGWSASYASMLNWVQICNTFLKGMQVACAYNPSTLQMPGTHLLAITARWVNPGLSERHCLTKLRWEEISKDSNIDIWPHVCVHLCIHTYHIYRAHTHT